MMKTNKSTTVHLKKLFDILGNTLIRFLVKRYMRRFIPRSCLCSKKLQLASG